MEALISIIIPIYNTESYLVRCLESVINQTYRNLEIILVDDGSTDCSGEICQLYGKIDKRIKILYQPNQRQAVARNNGLEVSSGEYIMFIDSDDYVALDICEYLLQSLVSHNADLATCEMVYLKGHDAKEVRRAAAKLTVLNTYEALKSYVYGPEYCGQSPCAKLYRRSVVGDTRFTINSYYEDTSTTYKFIAAAGVIVYLPQAKYFYTQNPDSTMNKGFSSHSFDKIRAYDSLGKFFFNTYPDLRQYANIHKLGAIFYCLGESYVRKLRTEFFHEIRYAVSVTRQINTPLGLKRRVGKSLIIIDDRLFGILYKLFKWRS